MSIVGRLPCGGKFSSKDDGLALSNDSVAGCLYLSDQLASGDNATRISPKRKNACHSRFHALSLTMYSRICQNCQALQPSHHYLPPWCLSGVHLPSTPLLRAKKQGRRKRHSWQSLVHFLNVGWVAAAHRNWNAISAGTISRITFTASNRAVTGRGTVATRYGIISQANMQGSQCRR